MADAPSLRDEKVTVDVKLFCIPPALAEILLLLLFLLLLFLLSHDFGTGSDGPADPETVLPKQLGKMLLSNERKDGRQQQMMLTKASRTLQ